MALYSTKTWIGISSYNSRFGFSAQNTIGDWDFHRKVLLLDYLSQFISVIFQLSCISLKSRESPGHSKTPLIS